MPNYLLGYPMLADDSIEQLCGLCEESHPATRFCIDCHEGFCDHPNPNQKVESHQEHKVIQMQEYHQYQQNHRHLGFLHPKSCIHHHKPFEYLNMETNGLLCFGCLSGKHSSLALLDDCASSLIPEKLERIRELGSQGTAHLAELRKEEDHFTSRLKELEESRSRSLSEIRNVFGSLHEALQTRQSELEREVEERSKSAGFALSEERERSRVWQGQLWLLEKCVEEINSSSLPIPPPSLSSQQYPSLSGLNPKKRPLPSSTFHDFLSEKALMVDACLLEDALRSSLSSSRASSSLTDVQSQLRVSNIRDHIQFSCSLSVPQHLKKKDLPHCILAMGDVTSTSSFQFNWSKNKVQSVMTFYSKGKGENQLFSPHGMTYSPDTKLFYVCDSFNNRIQVFRNHPQAEVEGKVEIEFLPPSSSSSSTSSSLNPPYTAPSPLSYPSDICYHDGQLFIVDHKNHRVQVWREKDGSFLRMFGTGSAGNAVDQFNNPWGCTVYQNHLFVSDSENHRIQKFSLSDFSVVKTFGSGSEGNELGKLKNPYELTVFNDKLTVVEHGNDRICVFDSESGAALREIGPFLPNDEKLFLPSGLLYSHNLLFVSSNHSISVFDSDHNYLCSFGSFGTGVGQFSIPSGMVMVDGKLFVCESGNGRVQVLQKPFD